MSVIRCAARHCREIMVDRLDGMGRVAFDCPKCERTKRGLCRDCPLPRAKGSLRCSRHRLERKREQYRRTYAEHGARICAKKKEKYWTNEAWREHRRAEERRRHHETPKSPLTRTYNAHKQRAYRARKRAARAE